MQCKYDFPVQSVVIPPPPPPLGRCNKIIIADTGRDVYLKGVEVDGWRSTTSSHYVAG